MIFLRDEIVEAGLHFAEDRVEIARRSIVGVGLKFAFRRWRRAVSGNEEGRPKTAWHKRQRSPPTGSPQEFPPAEFKEPTFFLRDLQAMLLFRETKNLALAPKQVNRGAHAAQPSDLLMFGRKKGQQD